MPRAYVLINTDPEVEEEFIEQIAGIDGVVEVDSVYGIYDFVAKVEADSLEKLKDIVTWKIRRLQKVRATVTLIAAGRP